MSPCYDPPERDDDVRAVIGQLKHFLKERDDTDHMGTGGALLCELCKEVEEGTTNSVLFCSLKLSNRIQRWYGTHKERDAKRNLKV